MKKVLMIVLLVVLSIGLVACGNDDETMTWDEYVVDLSHEDVYFVYVYSEGCLACSAIKNDIDAFDEDNAMDIPLIRINANDVSEILPSGTKVPTVFVIVDNEIDFLRIDGPAILGLLRSVELGNFTT